MKAVIIALFLISAATCAPALEVGVYAFFSNQTGQVLDLWGANQSENANLSTASFTQANHQLFVLQTDDNENYGIAAFHSLRALTAVDKKDSGVVQRSYTKAAAQQWRIIPKGNDLVAIQNRVTGKFLTVKTKSGEQVYQAKTNGQRTQFFRAVRIDKRRQVPIVDGGIYAFFSNSLKTAFDVPAVLSNGAKLYSHPFWGGANQYFLVKASGSNPEYVRILTMHSGKVLTASAGSVTQEDRKHGKDSQLWRFFEAQDGCYTMENKQTKQVLTLSGGKNLDATFSPISNRNKFQQFFAMRIQ